jgi:hypothetical protein
MLYSDPNMPLVAFLCAHKSRYLVRNEVQRLRRIMSRAFRGASFLVVLQWRLQKMVVHVIPTSIFKAAMRRCIYAHIARAHAYVGIFIYQVQVMTIACQIIRARGVWMFLKNQSS